MTDGGVIYAATAWANNSFLIKAAAGLGYLHREWLTLDPTWGKGNFWNEWRPDAMIAHDLAIDGVDFTALPHADATFDAVVFDPPYKLNGTPSEPDRAYGVHVPSRWQDRITLMQQGQSECARVLKPGGYLLSKCQDQVVSGQVRWQTDIMTKQAAEDGLTKVDRLDILTNPRPQPHSRQVHARRNYSTLLIFKKET